MSNKMMKIKDPFSGISHFIGGILSILGFILLLKKSIHSSPIHIIAFTTYGLSMIMLYFSSAAYHILPLNEKGTKRLKRLDHIMIYMLIAGTYTPFCLIPLRGPWGWSIFSIVWTIAFLGIFFKIFYINAPRWLSTILYLIMGWICIIAIYPMIQTIPTGGIIWLAAGGIMYSIGAVIYAIKKPNPWPNIFGFHDIWHLFVMAGSFCHFITMYKYIINLN